MGQSVDGLFRSGFRAKPPLRGRLIFFRAQSEYQPPTGGQPVIEQLRILVRNGCLIGSNTCEHQNLIFTGRGNFGGLHPAADMHQAGRPKTFIECFQSFGIGPVG